LVALLACGGWSDTYALLIGVERYSASEALQQQGIRAPDLPSTPNDLALTEQAVRQVYAGAGKLHVTVLLDAQTT